MRFLLPVACLALFLPQLPLGTARAADLDYEYGAPPPPPPPLYERHAYLPPPPPPQRDVFDVPQRPYYPRRLYRHYPRPYADFDRGFEDRPHFRRPPYPGAFAFDPDGPYGYHRPPPPPPPYGY